MAKFLLVVVSSGVVTCRSIWRSNLQWVLIACSRLMCKRSFGSLRARPCELCEIIHDFEGQNRAYTGLLTLFDLTSFGTNNALKANLVLPQSLVALEW